MIKNCLLNVHYKACCCCFRFFFFLKNEACNTHSKLFPFLNHFLKTFLYIYMMNNIDVVAQVKDKHCIFFVSRVDDTHRHEKVMAWVVVVEVFSHTLLSFPCTIVSFIIILFYPSACKYTEKRHVCALWCCLKIKWKENRVLYSK